MSLQTSYLIFATPRSGSYLLCEALTNTNLAGNPVEYFGALGTHYRKLWGTSRYIDYLDRLLTLTKTPNGVFGAKIIWQYFEFLLDELREIPGCEKLPVHELLATIFPNLHFIWITRRDKVRQAISYCKALQTGAWLSIQEQNAQASGTEPEFNFKLIDHLLRGIVKDEEEMRQFFARYGIQPYEVLYEEFITTYEETARQILEFLHIPLPQQLQLRERKLKKQGNAQNEEWVERYQQCKLQRTDLRGEEINLLDYFYQSGDERDVQL